VQGIAQDLADGHLGAPLDKLLDDAVPWIADIALALLTLGVRLNSAIGNTPI
jgi:hypothetical protein